MATPRLKERYRQEVAPALRQELDYPNVMAIPTVKKIVLNIGLELGVLSSTLFAMLVIMALVTTMMAPPLLPLLGYKQNMPQDTNNQIQGLGSPSVAQEP